MGEAADFFVSYTSTDRAWAEWIAWQLESEGYQVVIQAWISARAATSCSTCTRRSAALSTTAEN
jgi:hypothetical protein